MLRPETSTYWCLRTSGGSDTRPYPTLNPYPYPYPYPYPHPNRTLTLTLPYPHPTFP